MFKYLFVIEIADKEYDVQALSEEVAIALAQSKAKEDERNPMDVKSVRKISGIYRGKF